MEKKRKRIIIVSIILAITIIIGIVFIIANKNTNDVKVYDNVYIITKEESQKNIPIEVTDDKLIFNKDQHYSKDDIIVSGITDTAPNGFMRKVVKTDIIDNQYIVETTYACLTDVFEEAHVSKVFSISDEAVTPVDTADSNINAKIGTLTQVNPFLNTLSIGTIIPNENSDADLISFDVKKNITENIYVTGSVGYRPYLLMAFDIENHEIEYSMSIKNTTSGRLAVELGAEKGFNESLELFSKNLPFIEFMVGEVPIIITNSIGATLDDSGGIRGSLGTEITLDYENTTGFKYSSSTNQVEEIKENTYLGDGIEWNTKASASADIEVGVFIHIVSKLYDSTGVDLAAGITGGANAEIMASPNKQFNNLNYAGNIGLNITPKLKGDLVVTVPVIDYNLIQQPLFEKALNPLWKWDWKSSGNWKQDILKANPVTIDKNSKLYEMYLAILKYVKIEYETQDSIGFQMFYYKDENNIFPRGAGLGMADFNGSTPVYYLRDLNYDDIPELFIGKKSGKNYDILAVYSYLDIDGHPTGYYITSIGDYWDIPEKDIINYVYLTNNNEILIRNKAESGGEIITYSNGDNNNRTDFSDKDNNTIINSNDLDWKDLSEFSSDLKKSYKTTELSSEVNDSYKKELAYSQDGLEVYVSHKMGDIPIINITGTNNTNNDYYCYITNVLYKDKYSTMSPLYDITTSEPEFSISPELSFRSDESLNQKGYNFTIVVNNKNTNEEIFRKTFTGK